MLPVCPPPRPIIWMKLQLIKYISCSNTQIEGDFDDYRKEVLDSLGEVVNNPSVVANAAVLQ